MAYQDNSESCDYILLESLQLEKGVLAPNGWGQGNRAVQPANVSVKLKLRGAGFRSAARLDALDASTVHYGQLARAIRGRTAETASKGEVGPARVLYDVWLSTALMGVKDGRCVVAEVEARLDLPKAALFADIVSVQRTTGLDRRGFVQSSRWRFEVRGLRMAVLVGINAHERQARQPVVADIECNWNSSEQIKTHEAIIEQFFSLERALLSLVEKSAFETLEALAEHSVQSLMSGLLHQSMPGGGNVRLRFSKPRAIAFADAPAVEVIRRVPATVDASNVSAGLNVVRPYV